MVSALVLSGRVVYSFFATLCIGFGAYNLARFKHQILPHQNLLLFYLFSILCVAVTVAECLMDALLWYQVSWMIVNGVVRTFELCFIWCQTITFLLLSYRLSAQDKSGLPFEKDETQKRVVRRFNQILYFGLGVFFATFIVYTIFVVKNTHWGSDSNTDFQKPKYIVSEILFLVACFCTQVVLVFSIAYTIKRLNTLFPGANFKEHRDKIASIAILFCVSILVKTIYEWFMYYQHALKHK